MTWDNSTLQNFIRDRSFTIGQYLVPRQPEQPSNNPLIEDRIIKNQVLLREELDRIQGQDGDDLLTGQIVNAITLGSKNKPIPKDHSYSSQEVGDFMNYQNALEEWREIKNLARERNREGSPEVPSMSIMYSQEKEDFILVMSSGNSYIRELGIDIMENVIGSRYDTYLSNYNKALPEDIELYLINVDFDQLRLRLINAGYSNYVEEINVLLEGY